MADDEKLALSAATDGLAAWLIESGLLNRPVHKLERQDLEAMAAAAISGWVKKRSELAARPRSAGGPTPLHF